MNDGEIAVINRHKPLKIVTLDNHEGRVDIKKLQMSISQLERAAIRISCSRRYTSSPRPS